MLKLKKINLQINKKSFKKTKNKKNGKVSPPASPDDLEIDNQMEHIENVINDLIFL